MKMSKRYVGDLIFEALKERPGFTENAQELIASDWRKGASNFREYAESMVDEVFAGTMASFWGDFNFGYLETRIMEWVDPERDPWLWAYKTMTGALIDPATVRAVLRRIEQSA
jgi:hypothetical protein